MSPAYWQKLSPETCISSKISLIWYEKNTGFIYIHENFKGTGTEGLTKLGTVNSAHSVSFEKNWGMMNILF